MPIDLTEVQALFFEESFENLDAMESTLLDLEVGVIDKEMINTIFRAVHSIKGGAGIFKFTEIVKFAHVAETLLDEIRNEEHVITQYLVDLLLHFVDVMRLFLSDMQEDKEPNHKEIIACQQALSECLITSIESSSKEESQSTPNAESENNVIVEETSKEIIEETSATSPEETKPTTMIQGWHISFKPHLNMLQTGNDPIHMFHELEKLGELQVNVDTSQLPDFEEIDPKNCYLNWELDLLGNIEEAEIREIFEWVEEECELVLTPIAVPESVQIEENVEQDICIQPETLSKSEEQIITTDIETSIKPANKEVEEKTPELVAVTKETKQEETVHTVSEPEPDNNTQVSKQSTTKLESIKEKEVNTTSETTSIRVSIDKIDALINMVGELVITQAMLDQIGEKFDNTNLPELRDGLAQLERNTRELQENVMRIRMLPISFSFSRFPRLVHDLSTQLGKKVVLKLSGEHTELDKTVLEKMSDPLVHLVRNALDHGIETAEKRLAANKSEEGTLHLHAFHQSGSIIIQISDDGQGIDLEQVRQKAIQLKLISPDEHLTEEQSYDLIFHPGFSTARQISDLSGRGVGMDVVRRNIRDLGGTIEVRSKIGQGTTFSIRLPLTLAILDGQLIRVGDQIYILSLLSIIESLRVNPNNINILPGRAEVYKLRDDYIPVLRLYDLFDITPSTTDLNQCLLVVVEGEGQKIGL